MNPSSIRIPAWAYGTTNDWELLPHKAEDTDADYQFLLAGDFTDVSGLPPRFPRRVTGLLDGICTWCTVFDTRRMRQALTEEGEKFGMMNPLRIYFDERFYPGGGEDYDLNARMYRLESVS